MGLGFLDPGGGLTQLRRGYVGSPCELVAAFTAAPYADGATLHLGARAAWALVGLVHLKHDARPALLYGGSSACPES